MFFHSGDVERVAGRALAGAVEVEAAEGAARVAEAREHPVAEGDGPVAGRLLARPEGEGAGVDVGEPGGRVGADAVRDREDVGLGRGLLDGPVGPVVGRQREVAGGERRTQRPEDQPLGGGCATDGEQRSARDAVGHGTSPSADRIGRHGRSAAVSLPLEGWTSLRCIKPDGKSVTFSAAGVSPERKRAPGTSSGGPPAILA